MTRRRGRWGSVRRFREASRLCVDCEVLAVRWHRRTDAPVVLDRASGSIRWGRGSRCRERETVFPNHSSGVILQPDRLLQACLLLSVSFVHPLHPCFPPPFHDVHAVIAPPYTSSSYYIPLSVLPSLTPSRVPSHFQHPDFLFRSVRLLSFQHRFSLASLTFSVISVY